MHSVRRKILVTSALPYANGHIHVGHLVEYIQTDIWVRFQRMRGHDVHYFCADDTHGTAPMLRARQEGRTELELLAEMSAAHQRDFAAFDISFDHYGSTNSAANRVLCEQFWSAMQRSGLVQERQVSQLYDTEAGLFLADRLVRGTCPRCSAPDQYGDSCERCGATYSATELLNPRSAVSGAPPVKREALHLFIGIEKFHSFLEQYTQSENHLQSSVANYLKGHFLSAPLQDWDVSRPAPYFGFEIPGYPDNFWYVWFDAPIGYLASTQEWCERNGRRLDEFWRDPSTEIVHFIGKDITYFHALFWPVMLKTAGYNLPRRIQVHGLLTVNGEKMSKSRGRMIRASEYSSELDPSFLRYYYASRLTSKVDDLALDAEDFTNRVNADLVGKLVNLASRTSRFVSEMGLCTQYPEDGGLFAAAVTAGEEIAEAYEACDYSRAMRLVMRLTDSANEYVDREQPWKLAKNPTQADRLQQVCSIALNLYWQVVIYLAPVLPRLAAASAELLSTPANDWLAASQPLAGVKVQPFKHLLARVDGKRVAELFTAEAPTPAPALQAQPSKAATKPAATAKTATAQKGVEPLESECSIDDFGRVDLRVAEVVAAEPVEGSRKLLKLTVNLGEPKTRTIFAGIGTAYEAASLIGRRVIVVANLAPRTMKCGVSEGMVLAAGGGGTEVFVLSPDPGAAPGDRVH